MHDAVDGAAADRLEVRVSAARAGKERWTELELSRVDGEYLLVVRGMSLVRGETNYTQSHLCPAAEGVVAALRRRDGGFSRLAEELLERAGDVDPAILSAWLVETDSTLVDELATVSPYHENPFMQGRTRG